MNRQFTDDGAAQLPGVGAALGSQPREPFEADRKDGIFAVTAFVLGFFFVRWVMPWQGWGVTVFTMGYCLAVTVYIIKKGIRIPGSGWFWLAAVVLTGASYSLYANNGIEPWRTLFLFCSAVYYVLCATGRLILGNTGNWLLLDGINALYIIPFRNFGCQYKSLSLPQYMKKSMGRQVFSILLGLLLALLVAGMVLPLLMQADSGGFSKIANRIYECFQWIQSRFMDTIIEIILSIPVAAYIFGLVAGCAHDRGCRTFKRETVQGVIDSMRILPAATVYTALALISCLYLVFIGSQLPYFFSAFTGQRPEGWQIYSEYARSGFFELCRIAAINLFLLIPANLMCKKQKQGDTVLKIFNSLLSLITILLIVTALSKMALYIGAYGLSIRRLLPCVFMIFLVVVFGGIIALQKWKFSIMQLSAITGALMLCALSLLNPDAIVAGYNADRYLSGTLRSFDVKILYQSGPAGVAPALRVYAETKDEGLKSELKAYIVNQRLLCTNTMGQSRDNLQKMLVRQKTAEFEVRY